MSKKPKPSRQRSLVRSAAAVPSQMQFDEVLRLIDAARTRAVAAVNIVLVDLYWQIGEHISRRIEADGWGQGTVAQLADYIQQRYLVEFLQLPADHSEGDLQRALVEKLKQFLIELGRDFCFVGSQYVVQVGGRPSAYCCAPRRTTRSSNTP